MQTHTSLLCNADGSQLEEDKVASLSKCASSLNCLMPTGKFKSVSFASNSLVCGPYMEQGRREVFLRPFHKGLNDMGKENSIFFLK